MFNLSLKRLLMSVLTVLVIVGGGFILNFQYQSAMLEGALSYASWGFGMFFVFFASCVGWILGIFFINEQIED